MSASQLLRILQTFPTNVNNEICDFETDEVKEEAMKESPRRYTNPFLSDEENEKLNEENEKVNFWNNQELYTDKNVMECELPEFLVCYKENSFHVKDICVDEGIPHGERILFDDIIDETLDDTQFLKSDRLTFSECAHDMLNGFKSTSKDDNVSSEFAPDVSNESQDDSRDNDGLSECAPRVLNEFKNDTRDDDGVSECAPDIINEFKDDNRDDGGVSECAPDKLKISAESDSILKENDDDAPTEQIVSNSLPLEQDEPLPSLKSLLESINGVHDTNQEPCQSRVEESLKMALEGNKTEDLSTTIISNDNKEENNNEKPATSGDLHGVENPENGNALSMEADNNVKMANPVHRGEGESSFSVAGPVTGLITYSGPIAASGSVSLRSDSSTTSTRSFAFPILQNEWNSSPVRMAKADRRRLKQRGWRHGLLCCRF